MTVASAPPAEQEAPPAPGLGDRLRTFVTQSPGFVPALLAIGVFIWFAGDEGGFRGTTFLPAGIGLLALLGVSLYALPRPQPSRAALAGIGLLAAYAAWTYLSIGWAEQKGIAWDGANRTVLYAIVLALFTLWPIRPRAAVALFCVYAFAVTLVGLQEILRAQHAHQAIQFFHEGRLSEPSGYENANAALWFTAFWPALLLSVRRELPALLRGPLLGAAGLLCCLAIMGQSRAWLFAVPIMLVLVVVIVPDRGRTIAGLAAVGLAVAPIVPRLTDYYQAFKGLQPPGPVFDRAVHSSLLVAGILAVVGTLAALADRRVSLGFKASGRISAALVVMFALACGGAVGAAAVKSGHPVQSVKRHWHEFKSGAGEPAFTGARLASGSFQSYRSDLWRVAWENFKRKPLTGVGSDNFLRDYVQRGHTDETPSYPHSVEFRTLSETGLIGTFLLLGAFGAAIGAAWPALRSARALAGAAAGVALTCFAYWLVHGSADWFWEFPGLGAPAIGFLGLAGAVSASLPGARSRPLPGRGPLKLAAACLALAAAVAMAVPWFAERDLRNGRDLAQHGNLRGALRSLDRSSDLNTLSPLAPKTAALVELRLGNVPAARERLKQALDRDKRDSFAYLQLGAIASTEMHDAEARRLVDRARLLAPRDLVIRQVRQELAKGKTVTPERVNKLILTDIDVKIGPE